MLIHVDNAIRLLEADLPAELALQVKQDLTLINPKWEQVQSFGRWKNTQPRYLHYYGRENGVLIIPRGYISRLKALLGRRPYRLVDRTRSIPVDELPFNAELRPYQSQAVDDMLQHRFGVLEAPPGAGKTVMALDIIRRRRQPALVVVHTKELMYQWLARAASFTGLPEQEIGLIGDGRHTVGRQLTIAIINSLYRCCNELAPRIAHLVVDECHHIPARTFSGAVGIFDAAFMLGLSATPYRSDGLSRIINFYLGERRHCIDPRDLQALQHIMEARLVLRRTQFDYDFQPDDYQGLIAAMVADPRRNRLIADDVARQAAGGADDGIALVISERVAHCRALYALLQQRGQQVRLLTGDIPPSDRARIVAELGRGEVRVLVATARLIGEGFDVPHLSSIFLATPVKFSGRVKQYIGRILRMADGKEESVIYDYLDRPPVLKRSFKSRLDAYDDMGVRRFER